MNCAADNPRTLRVARAAEAASLAMVLHAGYDVAYPDDERTAPERVLHVHEAAPGLQLLLAHLGGWRAWAQVLKHLAGRSVYLETSEGDDFCQPDLLQGLLAKHDPPAMSSSAPTRRGVIRAKGWRTSHGCLSARRCAPRCSGTTR